MARWLLRWRKLSLTLWLALLAVCAVPAARIRVAFDIEDLFRESGHPDTAAYDNFVAAFGSDATVIFAGVHASDGTMFSADRIAAVDRATTAIRTTDGIATVSSLSTLLDAASPAVVAPGNYSLSVGLLRATLKLESPVPLELLNLRDLTPAVPAIQNELRTNPLTRGLYVSADEKTVGFVITLGAKVSTDEARAEVIEAIGGALDAAFPPAGYQRHMTGIPVIQDEYRKAILRDQAIFIPATSGFLIVVLFAMFRAWKPVAGALLVVGTTLTATLGLMSVTGYAISSTTTMLPVLVLILAVSDAIHLMHRYSEMHRERPDDASLALANATGAVAGACFSTSLTTAIGFLSLWMLNIPAIQMFGLFAAAATAIAYLVTMLTLPAFLSMTGYVPRAHGPDPHGAERPAWWLAAAESLHSGRRPIAVVLAFAAVFAAAGLSSSRIHVESRWFADFREDSTLVSANRFMEEHLAGTIVLSLHVKGGADGAMTTEQGVDLLKRLEQIAVEQDRLLADRAYAGGDKQAAPRVITVLSFAGLVDQLERGMNLRAEVAGIKLAEWSGLDTTRAGRIKRFYHEFFRFADVSLRDRLVSARARDAHVIIRMRDLSSRDAAGFVAAVEAEAAKALPAGYTVVPTGISLLAGRAMDRVVNSILWSVLTTLGLIALIVLIQLRSLRLALISIVPNAAPIVVTLGVMALLGIPFRFATVMIFSIALGIAVDNTIHLLVRFRAEYGVESKPNTGQAVTLALRGTGTAVLESTIILLFGFGLFLFSEFNATADFGRLGLTVFTSALIVSVLFTPALILLLGPRRAAVPAAAASS